MEKTGYRFPLVNFQFSTTTIPFNKHLKTYVIVNFQNCKELINSVEETGLILREIRDLEDQVLYETY